MIAAILSTSPFSYSVCQFTDVGRMRGHEIHVVDYRRYFGQVCLPASETATQLDSCVLVVKDRRYCVAPLET